MADTLLTMYRVTLYGLVVLCVSVCVIVFGQNTTFIAAESLAGGVVPNFRHMPPAGVLAGIAAHWAVEHQNDELAQCFGELKTGLTVGLVQYGNRAVYGSQYFVVPHVSHRLITRFAPPLWWRVGLGAGWFTKHHKPNENASNLSVGSALNFAFQAAVYREWVLSHRATLMYGLQYLHASNAHVQLPNFGINIGAVSLILQFSERGSAETRHKLTGKDSPADTQRTLLRHWYMHHEIGCGWHEYGGTAGPVGGQKLPVYFTTFSVARSVRPCVYLKAGLGYRYYMHYFRDITENRIAGFYENPVWSASNVYALLGSEILLGQVGIDVEGGLNLHKPFFKYFYRVYEGQHSLDYHVKQLFNSQLGLKVYLFKPCRQPRFNLSVGGHVNANFGQADFASLKMAVFYRM